MMKTMMRYNLTMLKRNALWYGLSCLFVVVVLLLVTQDSSNIVDIIFGITMFLLVYGSLLLVTTISMDRYEHGLNQLFLLPLSRNDYVLSKYMMIYGYTMILFIMTFTIVLLTGSNYVDNIMLLVACTCMAPILTSFEIPIYLKFDLSKARFVAMAVFAGLFLIVFVAMNIMSSFEIDFDPIRNSVLTNPWLPLVVVLTITVLINLISIKISRHLIQTIQD